MAVAMHRIAPAPTTIIGRRSGSPWRVPMAEIAGDRAALHRIDEALIALRRAGRRAVRIVDPRCGDGTWLFRAARHAAWLGFVAIEARGVDADPDHIALARGLAATARDPRVGFDFEVGGTSRMLDEEDEAGADIALCHGRSADADVRALSRVATVVVRMEGSNDPA
jgi:SAM-dependent methyltransferase